MQRRPAHRLRLLLLLLAASSLACIENRLDVDITTVVHADGSCTRRTVYSIERRENDAKPSGLPRAEDPFRFLIRLPQGEAWTIHRDDQGPSLTVVLEGLFPSANLIGWDYWRPSAPGAPVARNHFSFAVDDAENATRYEYSESWLDPASPFRALRLLAQALLRREDQMVSELLRRLPGAPFQKKEVRSAVHERLSVPLSRAIAEIAERPVYGPRERRETSELWDRLESFSMDLAAHLKSLAPSVDASEIDRALSETSDSVLGGAVEDLHLGPFYLDQRIHVRATLVMPAPIIRANTCAQGDTASWEFDAEDLFGRGFEMWAIASTAPSPEE